MGAEKIELSGSDWKMKEFIGLDWVWRNSIMPETEDRRWWYPAQVPGSVLHDLMENNLVPDPYYELNSKLVEWVSARTWVYRKKFFLPEKYEGKRISLVFEGIDYSSEIFLNGISLGKQEGMYIPWEKDIGEILKYGEENVLAVVLDAAPFEQPQVGKTSCVYTHKSRMTYWWDFCPRMIHQGIWQDVYLRVTEQERLQNVQIKTKLFNHYTEAEIFFQVEAECEDGCAVEGIFGTYKFGGSVLEGKWHGSIRIENPKLWWCNGQGEPYEYNVTIKIFNKNKVCSDVWHGKKGIREVIFEKNESVPEEQQEKGSFLLRLNGRHIYMNGYNWVPADVLYGAVSEEKRAHLIRLAKEAGVNILRVWGGGLIETDSFYRLCGEAGIMVWQEFILSSSGIENTPSETETYKELMKEQAEIIIKNKRNYTSLVIWCGGNELQDLEGNPLDSEHPLLHVLEGQVKILDAESKWLPTSPSGGVFLNSFENLEKCPEKLYDVHGPWEHQGMEKHYQLYNKGTCLLHSEFGVEGMTNYEALRKTTAPEHFLPASKDNPYYFHRGSWWNNEELVQETFGGGLDEIEQIRRASQYMQYEGLKYAVERNRMRAFANSGTFPWQFNEPYPNLYCTSALDYYGNPKPAYYGVKKVYGTYLINAKFKSACLYEEEFLKADIQTAINLSVERKGQFTAVAEVFRMDGTLIEEKTWRIDALTAHANTVGQICVRLKKEKEELLLLRLSLYREDERVADNEYLFTKAKDFADVLQMDEPTFQADYQEGIVQIKNSGSIPMLFLFISKEEGTPIYLKDNYFTLLPGEKRRIEGNGKIEQASIQGLNLSYRKIFSIDK